MSGSAPQAPDPAVTAAAQAAANRETAITQTQLNAMDQYNPWGSVTYQQNGNRTFVNDKGETVTTPNYSQTTTLSPEQQAIFNQTQGAQANLAQLAQSQSGKLNDYLGTNFQFNNDDASQWAYDLASPRILQQQGQNEAQLRTTMANKGIQEGSAAWNAEMGRMTNANSDQLNQLALTGRGQAFSEALAQRNQPINEITALLSGSQVSNPSQMSSATPQTAVAGTDVAGIYNNAYQNEVSAYNSKMGGIGGLFGAALGGIGSAGGVGKFFAGLSDRRLKENIRRIGSTDSGIPLYLYNFKGDDKPQIGVMAQELQEIMPHAVIALPSGILAVNYAEVR